MRMEIREASVKKLSSYDTGQAVGVGGDERARGRERRK